jgi:ABC-type Mn2+/Zn2+ transport system ATPase subunit
MILPYGGRVEEEPQPGALPLDIRGVELSYPGAGEPALEDVSFVVATGEKVALIGPNGAGKSTLIKTITGSLHPDLGEILIYGNCVGACHHRTAYVPQRSEVRWHFPVTVEQVVMMGRYTHLGWIKRPGRKDRDVVAHAIDAMGLNELREKQVGSLSGGQQQRVMIARALAQEADLLLLDEPLNNVDVRTQAVIFDNLDRLALDGKSILVSTHDLGTLQAEFSRVVFLDRTVIADGPVAEVLSPELLARAYGIAPHVCPVPVTMMERVN